MSVQDIPFPYSVRTYVTIPISSQSPGMEDLKNLGLDYLRLHSRVPGISFKINTETPFIIAGSFLAKDEMTAAGIAKKIQDAVRKHFEETSKYALSLRDKQSTEMLLAQLNTDIKTQPIYPSYDPILKYTGRLPNPNARDYVVYRIGIQWSHFIAKFIEESGGSKVNKPMEQDFLIVGEIKPAGYLQLEALHASKIERVATEIRLLHTDPKNLLFFTCDGNPDKAPSLDLKNPFSFPLTPLKQPEKESAKPPKAPATQVKTPIDQPTPVEPTKTHVTVEEPKAPPVQQAPRVPVAPIEETRAPEAPTEAKIIAPAPSIPRPQVSETQISQSIDTIATIQKRIDELLQTKNMFYSEGLDVSGIVIDIDELKKKRSASIAELYRATNP